MTLHEAYNHAYSFRNTELKGRFKTHFSYWRNGEGPMEDTQRKDLLKMGFSYSLGTGWQFPVKFKDNSVITILIKADELIDMIDPPMKHSHIIITIGDHYKIHIAGPKKELEKIEKKFGKPNK